MGRLGLAFLEQALRRVLCGLGTLTVVLLGDELIAFVPVLRIMNIFSKRFGPLSMAESLQEPE
jgi:hypothetical protein